jgi:dolichol-phosphate mannosyltransferase
MDADGSHNASYFASMWARRADFDIVIGSRYVAGGHTENPAILIWMSYVLNLTFRVVFNIHARDVTNSFRLYRTAILKPMKMESNDFDILEEILIKAVTCRPSGRSARDLRSPQSRREQAQAPPVRTWLLQHIAEASPVSKGCTKGQ